MSASEFIGKFAQGVAEVAVPAALQERAADIQAKRDARLQEYAQANQATQMEFQGSQREADRSLSQQQHTERLEAQDKWQGQSYELNKADREDRLQLLESQLQGSRIQNELGQINLDSQRDMREALAKINDPSVPEEERAAAAEYYNLLNPKAANKFKAIQKRNEYGDYINEWVLLNEKTGSLTDAGAPPGPDSAAAATGGGGYDFQLGAGGHTRDNPAKPKDDAAIDLLPKGAVFEDPDGGGLMVKTEEPSADEADGETSADRDNRVDASGSGDQTEPEGATAGTDSSAGGIVEQARGAAPESGQAGGERPLFSMRPRTAGLGSDAGIVERLRTAGGQVADAARTVDTAVQENIRGPIQRGAQALGEARRGGEGGLPAQGTEETPYRPASQAEVAALPEGAWYIDPVDGELRQAQAAA